MIDAKILACSISPLGKKLATFELRYPKFIHGEFRRSSVAEDLQLCDRLFASGHWSPAEHQATPDSGDWHLREHGNFVGWRQYRKILPDEAIRPLPEEYR